MKLTIVLLFIGAALWADDKSKVKAPVIPEVAQTAYWRARALADEARAVQVQAEQGLAAACGPEFIPQLDQAGALSCAPTPKPPAQ